MVDWFEAAILKQSVASSHFGILCQTDRSFKTLLSRCVDVKCKQGKLLDDHHSFHPASLRGKATINN